MAGSDVSVGYFRFSFTTQLHRHRHRQMDGQRETQTDGQTVTLLLLVAKQHFISIILCVYNIMLMRRASVAGLVASFIAVVTAA